MPEPAYGEQSTQRARPLSFSLPVVMQDGLIGQKWPDRYLRSRRAGFTLICFFLCVIDEINWIGNSLEVKGRFANPGGLNTATRRISSLMVSPLRIGNETLVNSRRGYHLGYFAEATSNFFNLQWSIVRSESHSPRKLLFMVPPSPSSWPAPRSGLRNPARCGL